MIGAATPPPGGQSTVRESRQRLGVTVIELLVTIGVMSVLFSIALPALMGSRVASRRLASLTNTRTIAADMTAYAGATGVWPFAGAGDAAPGAEPFPGLIAIPWWPPGAVVMTDDHWALASLWPGLVARVAPWEERFESWVSPGRDRAAIEKPGEGRSVLTPVVSYRYSNSFIASPALWSGQASADESLIAPTRPEDVAFPANKALVWDGDLAYLPAPPRRAQGHWLAPTPMSFADGHAAVNNPLEATPGAPNPLNDNSSVRLHNTPDGVLGRDY